MGAKNTQEHRDKIAEAVRRSWQGRRRRRFIYLAGPMSSRTADEARSWRRQATNALERAGFTCLDPTRRDKEMEPGEVYSNDGLSDGERRFIHDADLRDVRMAHVVLLYLGGDVSIGSVWEAGWADLLGKRIVIASPEARYRDHPFVVGCGAKVLPTLKEALVHIILTHGKVGL